MNRKDLSSVFLKHLPKDYASVTDEDLQEHVNFLKVLVKLFVSQTELAGIVQKHVEVYTGQKLNKRQATAIVNDLTNEAYKGLLMWGWQDKFKKYLKKQFSNVPKQRAEALIKATFDAIAEMIKNNERVMITGFGSFEPRALNRTVLHVQTREPIKVSKRMVRFVPARVLREYVNGSRSR